MIVVDSTLNRLTVHNPENGEILGEIKGKTPDKSDLFNEPYYVTTTKSGYTVVTDWVAPNIKVGDPRFINVGHQSVISTKDISPKGR